jgi:ATP-binding cassette subfamily F protein 3
LACLALQGANLLLLDEPTNHLDLPTQEVLESVLSNFPGTILLVSHDRYLIDSLASQIWEVDPQGKTLHVFKGSYTQYKAHKLKLQELQLGEDSKPRKPADRPRKGGTGGGQTRTLSKHERKVIQSRLAEIEKRIQSLEKDQAHISSILENPPIDANEVPRLGEEYVALQKQVEALLAEWSALEEKIAD